MSLAALDIGDNKPDQAQKRFDVVLAADPKNMHALLAVAGLRSRAGAPARDVAALLGDVVRLHPAEVSPRLVLVEHHLAHNEPKLALTVAQDAAAVLPRDADLLDALGRTQAAVGERNQAINSFNKLASLQPRSPQASMRLADLYRDGGNADQARHYLKRALDVEPDLLEAQRALADLELKSGHPNEALAIARTVRRQRPSDPVGFSLEGSVEFQKKNFQAAIDLFRAGLKQSRSVELACKLHAALAASGKQTDADKLAASWLAEHPGDTVFLSYLADNLLAERKYQAAEDLLRRVDRLMPGNAVVMNNIAWSMVQQDKPEAVEYAQKANDLFPNVPALMDTLAAALLLRNRVAEAIDIQKKALAITPDAHGMRLSLARMYIQAGDKPAARAELDRLAKLQGPNSQRPEAARLLKML